MDVLYGRNSVGEALRAGRKIHRVLIADGAHGLEALVAAARQKRIPYEIHDRRELDPPPPPPRLVR